MEVAEEATPKASPWPSRRGGGLYGEVRDGDGAAYEEAREEAEGPDLGHALGEGLGEGGQPAEGQGDDHDARAPKRAARRPPSREPSEATRAAVPMIQPAWLATLSAAPASVPTNPGNATEALVIDTCTASRVSNPGRSNL
jgi:hypothetical protein